MKRTHHALNTRYIDNTAAACHSSQLSSQAIHEAGQINADDPLPLYQSALNSRLYQEQETEVLISNRFITINLRQILRSPTKAQQA